MSRINTNVNSLLARRNLNANNASLNTSLQRLSTGLKINKGADDPSGLIASENLRAEKAGIAQALDNAERAANVIGTAEGGLTEISALLTEMQALMTESANSGGLSKEEVEANQLQVDSILSTINRLANNTEFQGKKLLDGSLGYTNSSVAASAMTNLRINSARLPDGATQTVVVQVVASAQTGLVSHSGSFTGNVTLEVGGNKGTEQISMLSGTTVANQVAAINAVKDATGVSASVSGARVVLRSQQYGADGFVSVKAASGTYAVSAAKDEGRDATVTVNGATAETDGLNVKLRTANLDVEFDVVATANVPVTKTFGVTGGGAEFALGGRVSESIKKGLGIDAVTTTSLGKPSTGFLSSIASGGANAVDSGNVNAAQEIVSAAIKQVSQLRGRLGAFQKYELGSTVNALGVAYENLSAAESSIRDTDFAEETANLTRSQILSQAASSVLAQANAQPQAALSLLQ